MTNGDFVKGKVSDKELKTARQNGFIYNQIKKLTIKVYSNLSKVSLRYVDIF